MILLPSASCIVCCGLYGLPSKLLEKRPAARLMRVRIYLLRSVYISITLYTSRARLEPVLGLRRT